MAVPIRSVHPFHVFCEILAKNVVTTDAATTYDNSADITVKLSFIIIAITATSIIFAARIWGSRRSIVTQPEDLIYVGLERRLVLLCQIARVAVGVGELVAVLLEEVAEPLVPPLLHELDLFRGPSVKRQGAHKADVHAVTAVLSRAVYAQIYPERHGCPCRFGSPTLEAFL